MKRSLNLIIKRALYITLILIPLLIGSYVSILAFPQILLTQSVTSGTVVI